MKKILTINSHTPYHYLLSKTGYEFDVLNGWDRNQRPLPLNMNLVSEKEAKMNIKNRLYKTLIAHRQLQDLRWMLLTAFYKIPIILVYHGRRQRSGYKESRAYKFIKNLYNRFIIQSTVSNLGKLRFVFITPCVKVSWTLCGKVINPGIDINDLLIYQGVEETILVVAHRVDRPHFAFDILTKLIQDKLPIQVIGENPKLPNSKKAKSFDELKEKYARCRVFLNLCKEPEEGFNLSLLEAMATGMPIITLEHPTSPIRDGYNGFVAHSYKEFIKYLRILLKDKELALKLGSNARATVKTFFSINDFIEKWKEVMEG